MMLVDEVVEFLKSVPPFHLLDEETVLNLALTVALEFYPAGTLILSQDGPPSEWLQVVVSGGAKVFLKTRDEEEVVIDYRSKGDTIGFLSLFSGDRSRTNVLAVEDTSCYLIPREPFLAALEANPQAREYFLRTFITKYMDKAFADMRNRSLLFGGGERLLFSTPVGELITRKLVSAPVGVSIQGAAEIMAQHRISSLVLVDEDGSPAGMVTDRDLRDKVAAKARSTQEPAAGIMSAALIKADAMDYCFEALLKMIRHNIHHLLVVENGHLKGVITNHDLMVLQGTSPLSIVREIESQLEVEGLALVAPKINGMIGLLLKEGAKASNVTRIITEINDRLVRKIIELGRRRLGPSPLPFCWISFGSEGRKEQMFKTDQDNAIVYADPASAAEETAAGEYFPAFAAFMKESLVRCGFTACPANYMASNPQWCQPLEVWKGYFSKWIAAPGPESLLHSLIFFDFRPLAGALTLGEELRAHLARTVKNQNIFFARMAGAVTKHRPPLGFFGSLVVEKSGEHINKLNLKISGLGPIVDIARFCALEAGIAETATLERLHALRDHHPLVKQYGDELAHAFEFLSLLRVHHQFGQLQSGGRIDNFIDPKALSAFERKTLKDSFRVISRVQDLIVEDYRAGMVGG